MADIENDLDTFESWKDDMLRRKDYEALNEAAYEAAVWLEDNANVKDEQWTTLNNATSLFCSLANRLAAERAEITRQARLIRTRLDSVQPIGQELDTLLNLITE